jgi:hypothetical protein
MRTRRSLRASLAAVIALTAGFVRAEPELRFDPFRPQEGAVRASAGAASGRAVEAFVPELRATLISRAQSLVDFGGVILALGEEAHGYKLLEVWPYAAVFEFNGGEIVVEIAEPLRVSAPAAGAQP